MPNASASPLGVTPSSPKTCPSQLDQLGRAGEGFDLLRPGLALPLPRVQVTLLGHTATARLLQDEPEQTCADLLRALDLTAATSYPLGVERVLGVRDRFPDPWADLSCVRNLDERLLRA